MTQLERLAEYRRKNSPLGGILSNIQTLKGDKGDPGYTPVKGKDYFTSAEIQSVVSFVRSQVKDGVSIKGNKGDSIKGNDGYTPIRGIDFWTAEDILKIKKDIEKLIPKIEKAKPIDIKAIAAEIKLEYKDIKDAPNFKEIEDLVKFLKSGGFRGGGSGTLFSLTTTGTSGAATLANNILNIPQYSGGGGGGFTQLTATGTVNGTNLSFTFTQKPTYIVSDGIELTQLDNNGGTQWSWNAGTLTATMVVPPINSIFGFLNTTSSVIYYDNEVASGSGTSFTIAHTPDAGSVNVYGAGQRLTLTADYTISGTTITTVNSWNAGDIVVDYRVGGSNFVDNEVVSGSGTSFTLANTPIASSVHVYGTGQRLYLTTDYSISGTTITTVNSWNANNIISDYRI